MSSTDREPFEVEFVEELSSTDAAILVKTVGGFEVWIPRSQVIDRGDLGSEEPGYFTIPEWLAIQKGLA